MFITTSRVLPRPCFIKKSFDSKSPLDREPTVFLSLAILNAVSNNLYLEKVTYTFQKAKLNGLKKKIAMTFHCRCRRASVNSLSRFCHHLYYLDSLVGLSNLSAVRGLLFNAGLTAYIRLNHNRNFPNHYSISGQNYHSGKDVRLSVVP